MVFNYTRLTSNRLYWWIHAMQKLDEFIHFLVRQFDFSLFFLFKISCKHRTKNRRPGSKDLFMNVQVLVFNDQSYAWHLILHSEVNVVSFHARWWTTTISATTVNICHSQVWEWLPNHNILLSLVLCIKFSQAFCLPIFRCENARQWWKL